MNETVPKPSPHAEGPSKTYWDGTRKGRLMLQRCASCGTVRHYPQVVCAQCYSDDADWVEACGLGRVYSWTVAHHAFHPGFVGDVPYTLVTVDLDEGVRALGLLDGVGPEELEIGVLVKATFPTAEDGFGRLTFIPA